MRKSALAFTVLTAVFLSVSAFAGEGGSTVKCRSASGAVSVDIFNADGGDSLVKLSHAGSGGARPAEATYVNKAFASNLELNGRKLGTEYPGARIAPIVSMERADLMAYIVIDHDADGWDQTPFELVSVSGSVKYSRAAYERKATFRAKLRGLADGKTIALNCVSDYSI